MYGGVEMKMELSEESKYIIKLVGTSVTVYLAFRYLLPIFMPLVFAWILKCILEPGADFLSERFRINKKITSLVFMLVFLFIVGSGLYFLSVFAMEKGRDVWDNLQYYENQFEKYLERTLKGSGIENADKEKIFSEFVKYGMTKSINTARGMVNLFVFLLTTIITTYFLMTEKPVKLTKISRLLEVKNNVVEVCKAYVKTQAVIMVITASICFAAFSIMKAKYPLILGIIVGIMDSLPAIGLGVMLLPAGIICIIKGKFFSSIIIFITYIICYIIRQIIEPKLMGRQIGISAVETIISMFAGFRLFGIAGVILGPLGYVIIKQLV